MATTVMTLRIVVIDHADGAAGVAECRESTRYDLADTKKRNQLAVKLAEAAMDNLNATD